MIETNNIQSVYFVGAGGIGMSALVRYYLAEGKQVGGYDKTPSPLTDTLIAEGAQIHFCDDVSLIPEVFRQPQTTLVVYTPAIPADHSELNYFRQGGFTVMKRAQVLGLLTDSLRGLCVAGTHGKTTTSTMTAHLLHQSHVGCNAFLGGISKNYETNYLHSAESQYVVIEADEFDRSFHWLHPWASVITSTDPDHLDIYGTKEAYLESFNHYTTLVRPSGTLIIHTGLEMQQQAGPDVKVLSYSRNEGDYHAENIRIGGGEIVFDFVSPNGTISDVWLGVPIPINIENAIAAMALAQLAGATDEELREGMRSFAGVDRRFDFKLKTDRMVLLSDYGHHPKEIEQSIRSVREIYPDRRIAAVFQPHLYSRTRDFYKEFASALSLLDEVFLCDIYPAREQPIPGVSSKLIYDNLRPGIDRHLITKEQIPDIATAPTYDVLISLGAGDLEDYVPTLVRLLQPFS